MLKKWMPVLLMVFLVGCSDPIPTDRLHYAGEWQSREMYLLILADGTVDYKRLKDGGSVSINAPLKEFHGDNFDVGIGPFSTTFQVSEPPHQEDNQWVMVVDGVRLTKSAE
ncbi:hypothetical protein BTA51_20385 [Hahella sp. CCB-MM4]|uniref:hypothetical protein n=1 Tax=Hahella sp. (strain CCB-MM4) TaxID=1926491 RepID=UPI000B9AF3F9|nr:hypothetical protein [Hahella sp. CCB-MM4]OZG71673.1 hypothetical protein BTA51_20385 [Hahella sp. CCB-MM4]